MPSRITRRSIRALPGLGAGLGMSKPQSTASGGVKAATYSQTFVTPGMPMVPQWDANLAVQSYLGHTYVMRCVRLRADTVAGLPFVAGPDPADPTTVTEGAPLARLLGPASPQNPGGPNPTTTARALWAWSICQYLVTGRMAWELQLDGSQIAGLWPLVSAALQPVPSPAGSQRWFDGYVYQTPSGERPMTADQVFYAWRPSMKDWRQPESALEAGKLPIEIAQACDRYLWSLLSNGMVASKMVVTPDFATEESQRAFEAQFFAEFSGFDNAGKTIFAQYEEGVDPSGKPIPPSIQVVDLATKSVDAQLLEMVDRAKSDINIALGVPKSLIGDASQRIYANADSEYRNFWTTTAIGDITELQDFVNLGLAPLLGDQVGWWDLDRVVALQPPTIFQPPALKDAIDEGVVTPAQAADLLNIPTVAAVGEDAETAPIGEEAVSPMAGTPTRSAGGVRRLRPHGQGSRAMDAPAGWMFRRLPLNTTTLRSQTAGWGLVRLPRQKITVLQSRRPAPEPELAATVLATVAGVRSHRSAAKRASKLVASGVAVKAADTGRVLMLQRHHADSDPAAGKWDFPGGHIEDGEDAQDAAVREWQEETGVPLPDGKFAGSWTSQNGIYRGHLYQVPDEASVPINMDPAQRKVLNPDDPDGDMIEVVAWFDPDDLPDNPAVRDEVRDTTDWDMLGATPSGDRAAVVDWDRIDALGSALAEAG